MQEEGASNEAGGGVRAVLICPAPPVERRGTQPAPGQSLCLSLKVPLIPFQRGKEMQMCGGMFSCVCVHCKAGPCISKGPMLIETLSLCHSAPLSFSHILLYALSFHNMFSTSPRALPGPGFNICKVGTQTYAHTAFISASPATLCPSV